MKMMMRKKKRTVQKLSEDNTDKNLRVLGFKEEEKEDNEDETVDNEKTKKVNTIIN